MPGEFEIIQRYFSFSGATSANGVELAVGDDAAVIDLRADKLIVATDTLVEGAHFLAGTLPEHIATRALAVNLSDFAAMGVKPRWFSLSLTLPENDEAWIAAFSKSLARMSGEYDLALVGGDTCRGPLNISITMMGESTGQYLRRSGAAAGDDLWVSNELGRGSAGLALLQGSTALKTLGAVDQARLEQHFYAPQPQLELGLHLVELASAALDVSDGVLADAKHIAECSKVAIEIQCKQLPFPKELIDSIPHETLLQWACGGDDYQLLFTASPGQRANLQKLAKTLDVSLARIGRVVEAGRQVQPVVLLDEEGHIINTTEASSIVEGYRHF